MRENTACLRVGRLLEVDVRAGYRTVSDVDMLFSQIDSALARMPQGQKHVTCADWRYCQVMAPETSLQLKQKLAAINARTERSAALASADSPTAVMQFMRLIREANLPDRKVFLSATDAVAWLGEVLTPEETARLRAFLRVP